MPYLAQYGKFTAGVVSAETRRGGDKWDYSLNDPFPDFRIRSGHLEGVVDAAPTVQPCVRPNKSCWTASGEPPNAVSIKPASRWSTVALAVHLQDVDVVGEPPQAEQARLNAELLIRQPPASTAARYPLQRHASGRRASSAPA